MKYILENMGKLCVIQCTYMVHKDGPVFSGIAICLDSNSEPITIIDRVDGRPFRGKIWSYTLQHYKPWVEI